MLKLWSLHSICTHPGVSHKGVLSDASKRCPVTLCDVPVLDIYKLCWTSWTFIRRFGLCVFCLPLTLYFHFHSWGFQNKNNLISFKKSEVRSNSLLRVPQVYLETCNWNTLMTKATRVRHWKEVISPLLWAALPMFHLSLCIHSSHMHCIKPSACTPCSTKSLLISMSQFLNTHC